MNQTLQTVTEWLEAHRDQTLLITKREMDDLDRVKLHLDNSEFQQLAESESIDDYTDGVALLLHGEGAVLNGGGEHPLPQDTFVISMAGLSDAHALGDSLELTTERASYTIMTEH
ncbi:MAG TPA: hypothetical protein VMS09_02255 [Paenibacillus sp.]|uniref:hypothetical protein n=1 Tax=Paenibacillus sp. TaxID=58172 RepID=UPI0028D20377|nr:hypothetical protein [Paenibacillus sp.]HUC90831.1 hypothetical protein [Paenibacillus sp.]